MSKITSTGIIRKTDDLGRIVIPKEIVKSMNYSYKQPFNIYVAGDYIILSPGEEQIGFIRNLDELNRIVVPKEIRDRLSIKKGTPLEIFVDSEDGSVALRKYTEMCVVCGNMNETYTVKNGKKLCDNCIEFIKENF